MLKGFRDFIMRGNVVDLAVGVVIGSAFGSVVTSLVKDVLTPLIGAIAKVPDFSGLAFTINGSHFMYGAFLNALIAFVLIAASIYFFVIVPMNKIMAKVKKGEEVVAVPADIQLLTEIRDALRK
ncbi:MAG: large conductance mechanosensitive channel protein MscL [Candidatus Doudnabacteria bacterium]|nr:large conductance mechanosensitive channel protein MscL [Candidatus Doudnabacteria bacterium]